MTAIRSRHGELVVKKLNEWRDGIVASLAAGNAADYPTYRNLVGRIQGIDDALKIAEEADFELNGGT